MDETNSTTGLPLIEAHANIILAPLIVKATATILTPVLHIDLLQTDLADFLEHFEHDLGWRANQVLGIPGKPWLWDDRALDRVADDAQYTLILSNDIGAISREYSIYKKLRGGEEEYQAQLRVVRYRRDRLRLTLFIAQGEGREYAKHFRRWLEQRWGKGGREGDAGIGYIDLNMDDVEPIPRDKRDPGRRKHIWNKDAIERLKAGEDEDIVKAAWREAYKEGHESGEYPEASADGEYKTWLERVMKPYRDEIGRNRMK